MSGFSMILNIITILLVSALFAFVFFTHTRRVVQVEPEYVPASRVYRDMSQTRNYETIRMTEPFSTLEKDNGPTGSFKSIDHYITYMVTF